MSLRLDKMSSFIVMDLVREASKIKDAVHFEVGQPDIAPSPKVLKAMKKALKQKVMPYTPSLGLDELREEIALFYKKKYNVNISASQVAVVPGTSGGFLAVYALLLDQAEKLAFSDPGYPCYKNFSHLLNIEPVFLNVDKSTEYEITVEQLKKHPDLKALQISSPANPTGNIYNKDNFKALIEYCDANDIHFISDEIYHGLTYGKKEHTALEFSKKSIVLNSFSKYFCGPGLRLGWVIVPEELIPKMEIVLQNAFISAPTLSQYGALKAFDYEYLDKTQKIFEERRNFLYQELSSLFEIDSTPDGAFYLWAKVDKYSNNSFEFANQILKQTGVAVTPGLDFGSNQTSYYLRFAYTRNIKHMREGIKRLKNFLKTKV